MTGADWMPVVGQFFIKKKGRDIMSFDTLKKCIISQSVAQDWESARREWTLQSIEMTEEPDVCSCGHNPIYELCFIENSTNGEVVVVGNRCVQQFLGLPSKNLFAGLKRIKVNASKSMNRALIEYARGKGWLDDWEYGVCIDTMRKRKLTVLQNEKRVEINRKVVAHCVRRRNPPASNAVGIAS